MATRSRPQVRLALTIAGAVSLGAYEGGALAALLVAIQTGLDKPKPPIVIDVIGGASAGSITGLMAGRALAAGLDPVKMMFDAWVERDDLSAMISHKSHEPLSMDGLKTMATELLDPKVGYGRPRQKAKIHIRMALGCLRGLNYQIQGLAPGWAPPVEASTYLDWSDFPVTGGPGLSYQYTEAGGLIESALASGANAFGYPPRWLDRHMFAHLYGSGVTNKPSPLAMWYTDGGTVNNEPIGQTLDLVHKVRAPGHRLLLLIHPHPEVPIGGDYWAKPPDTPPDWLKTGARAAGMAFTHGIYEDLRRAAKTNSRIEWTEDLAQKLADLIGQVVEPDQLAALNTTLETFIHDTEEVKAERSARTTTPTSAGAGSGLQSQLLLAIQMAAGLEAKRRVDIEVISPLILSPRPAEQVLAGAFLMSFGGFLERDLRVSDFDLGYRSMQRWLDVSLPNYVSDEAAKAAQDAARMHYDPVWGQKPRGGAAFADLSRRDQLKAVWLGRHLGRVLIEEIFNPREP